MRHLSILLFVLLVLLVGCTPALAGVPRWDALPALDVEHLAGPHAGTRVCPMCRYGYDAGLLVLVPAALAEGAAAEMSGRLGDVARRIGDERFRAFIVVEGTPAPALLDRLRSDAPGWHVARGERFPDALFDSPDRSVAYVFAQRRVLAQFDPRDTSIDVDAHAHAAMRLLAATYAHAVSDIDPDTPKGKLWLAPMHLDHRARIGADDSAPARRICLVDAAGRPMPGTLLALRSVPSMRVRPSQWLRTDDEGCLSLSGADATVELHAEGFVVDGSAFAAQLDTQPRDMPLRPRLHRTDGSAVSGRERVVGLPCEDCADILATAPTSFASQASLADLSEPGERLHVSGVVRDRSGHPRAGVILFAYQTDAAGLYHPDPRAGGLPSAQARLRGWVRSDSDGRYRLDTIRPGHYPGRAVPAHIHLHVVEPGRCTWYAGDILFSDDPLLDTTTRAESNRAHGGSGIVDPRRGSDGSWSAERDLMLGLDVAGYEACRATDSS